MHSSRRWRRASAMVAVLAAAAARADAPAPAHCTAGEVVAFSCQAGAKVVSLCALRQGGRIGALAYRYGLPGHVENEYVASLANRNRFFASVAPAAPRASVSQVWFGRGKVKYLITECTGGDCPYSAALSVLRGDRVLSHAPCLRTADDRAWFSRELVEFGSDIESSRSTTDLLRLEEGDNPLEKLYRIRAKPGQ
jgi:hypothetical protein